MTPILIYPPEEAERNGYVVDRICTELGARLVTPDYDGEAEYVVNRTNNYKIGEKFEKRGIRVFNPSTFSRLANDKQKCYDFMQSSGIGIMPTRVSTPPFIKKPKNGHGGIGVVMCNSTDEYDENMVCQAVADDIGKDLRVWVIGGKIITAILRESKGDFRSNYCLGGSATPYELSEAEQNEVKKIITLVNGDYYGIDFVFNAGKIVFNELEDTVGARMVYDKTDIDIIRLYCEYIRKQIKGNG